MGKASEAETAVDDVDADGAEAKEVEAGAVDAGSESATRADGGSAGHEADSPVRHDRSPWSTLPAQSRAKLAGGPARPRARPMPPSATPRATPMPPSATPRAIPMPSSTRRRISGAAGNGPDVPFGARRDPTSRFPRLMKTPIMLGNMSRT